MWILFGKLGLKYRPAPIFNYWVLYIFKGNFSDFHHVSLHHASCGHHFIFQQFPSYFHIFFVRISRSLKYTTVSELVSVESVPFLTVLFTKAILFKPLNCIYLFVYYERYLLLGRVSTQVLVEDNQQIPILGLHVALGNTIHIFSLSDTCFYLLSHLSWLMQWHFLVNPNQETKHW